MKIEGTIEQTIHVNEPIDIWAVAVGDCAFQKLTFQVGGQGRLRLWLLDCSDSQTFERHTEVLLETPGAECRIGSVFLASGTQQTSQTSIVRHLAANCQSEQQIRGVASGSARGLFEGLIYVAPCAQETVALQENHNILLSDAARIETRPQLEIYADSVKCNHGATVGREDPLALFYLRQRGIPIQAARTLLLAGFCRAVLPTDNEDILELLNTKLAAL